MAEKKMVTSTKEESELELVNEDGQPRNRGKEAGMIAKDRGFARNVWWVLVIVSCASLAFNVLAMSNPGSVLEMGLNEYAGSSFDVRQLDEDGRRFLEMAMIKPLWEGLWVVVFGIFIALKLRQRKEYAWTLGIMWSVMLLAYGVIQGGYEMAILGWSSPCFQTYLFLVFGTIPLISLLAARKGFSSKES